MSQRPDRPQRVERSRPRLRSGFVVSMLLHGTVLAALPQLAGLAPPPPARFDVFAADPLDTPAETAAVVASAPAPPPRTRGVRRATPPAGPTPAVTPATPPPTGAAAVSAPPAPSADTGPQAGADAAPDVAPSRPSFAELEVAAKSPPATPPDLELPPRPSAPPPVIAKQAPAPLPPSEPALPPAPVLAAPLEPAPAMPLAAAAPAPGAPTPEPERKIEAGLAERAPRPVTTTPSAERPLTVRVAEPAAVTPPVAVPPPTRSEPPVAARVAEPIAVSPPAAAPQPPPASATVAEAIAVSPPVAVPQPTRSAPPVSARVAEPIALPPVPTLQPAPAEPQVSARAEPVAVSPPVAVPQPTRSAPPVSARVAEPIAPPSVAATQPAPAAPPVSMRVAEAVAVSPPVAIPKPTRSAPPVSARAAEPIAPTPGAVTPSAPQVSERAAEPVVVAPPAAGQTKTTQEPVASPAAPPGAVARVNAAPPTTSSPLGLGFGRLRIRLDGAATRTTDRAVETISGTLVGGTPEGVLVQVDGQAGEPKMEGRDFTATVNLMPGVNHVRVVAIDAQGAQVEEVVSIRYVPSGPVVALTSPRDGHTLGPDDPPVMVVEGEVSDASVSSVWIAANDRRVAVPVTNGKFRRILPLLEPTVRVRAEPDRGGRASATATVHAAAALPSIALVLDEWPRQTVGPARVTMTWRPNPSTPDGATPPFPMKALTVDSGEAGSDIFFLRNARPGVYTFYLTYRPGAAQTVRPLLYVAGSDRAQSLAPVKLDTSGRAVLLRLLLPHGVLWEQDDWFSGRSASGDTVTKFRFPDGVTWTERFGNIGR